MSSAIDRRRKWVDEYERSLRPVENPLKKEDELVNRSNAVGTLATQPSPDHDNLRQIGAPTHKQTSSTKQIGDTQSSEHPVDDVPDTMEDLEKLIYLLGKSGTQIG